MNYFKILCLVAVVAFSTIGCGNDDDMHGTGELDVNFKAMFDEQPLVMNEVVDLDGSPFRINVSEFYVSDIKLSNLKTAVNLADVGYVSFTGQTSGGTSTLVFDEVPEGQYTELSFYIGIPANLNATAPEDYLSNNPLSNSATYWNGWLSYIFSKLEGKLDTNGDGETDLTYVYHSGKDELYTRIVVPLTNQMDIYPNVQNDLNILIDHQELFVKDNGFIDIEAKPTAHNPEDLEYPAIILGNFQNAITVE